MSSIVRGPYSFSGSKAADSVKYYDIVISHGYSGDMTYLAWDAAYKFGSRVIGPGFVSYRHGLIYGDNAVDAADFFDSEWEKAFDACPEEGRRAKMRSVSNALKRVTEARYDVIIKVMAGYYY